MKELMEAVRTFRDERDWARFHTPKNLAMALIVEAAELVEHFQWQTPEQSQALDPETRNAVAEEIADVLIYLVNLADVLGIDPLAAAERKLERNRERFPVAGLAPGGSESGA